MTATESGTLPTIEDTKARESPGVQNTPGASLLVLFANRLQSLPPLYVALAYLLALTVAEVLSNLIEPRVGMVVYGILLTFMLLHTAMVWEHPIHKLLLSLVLAPLIRMMSFSLPLVGYPLIYWYFIISVPLFAAAFLIIFTLRLPLRGIGIRFPSLLGFPVQGIIATSGFLLGYVEYRILQPEPLAQAFTLEQIWLPALILLVSTGFAEELFFRGIMQRTVKETLGRFEILYVSVLFAILHVGYKSLIDVVFVFVVAVYFGWIVIKTRSLLGVTIAHGLTNIMLFLVMPLWPASSTPVAAVRGFFIPVTPTPIVLAQMPDQISTLTPVPTLRPTQTPIPPPPTIMIDRSSTVLKVSALARVAVPQGIKLAVRATPSGVSGQFMGELEDGAQVVILEGPVDADNLRWWKVDNGLGLMGWAAEGSGGESYLVPLGALLPTSTPIPAVPTPVPPTTTPRPPPTRLDVGVLARVTMPTGIKLNVRATPGTAGQYLGELEAGVQVKILEGPVEADNFRWWKIYAEQGLVGWSAEGTGGDIYLVPEDWAP